LCENRLGQFVPAGASRRPGKLLGPLALMLAAGGHMADLDMSRQPPEAFRQVASNATVSRFLARAAGNIEGFTHGFETLTWARRSTVWAAAGQGSPTARATAADPLIIDLDATLVGSHSQEEGADGDYEGGYRFSPFTATCDHFAAHGGGES
jgi:hypothetical protein